MKIRLLPLFVLLLASAAPAAEPQVWPLWPNLDKTLISKETLKDRGTTTQPNRFISNIAYPTLTILLPPKEKSTHVGIIICPGGGYSGVAIDKEGYEIAAWLNSIGHAAFILKYRMPHPEITKDGQPLPLLDAQRAIRYVRSHAKDYDIHPNKVGIMGFSAGGHLASTAATHFDRVADGSTDPEAAISDRPDFVVLAYPVITMEQPTSHKGSRERLLGDNPDAKMVEDYSNEKQVTPQTPPTFLVHAKDDPVKCENSILFHDALVKAKVPTELHLLEKAGHGFGLGTGKPEASEWPQWCEKWIRSLPESNPER